MLFSHILLWTSEETPGDEVSENQLINVFTIQLETFLRPEQVNQK